MNVYEIVTNKIIEQLESGVVPWRKPWKTLPPVNIASKRPYSGLNVLLLGTQGYASPFWGTYRQFQNLGAHVKQGQKSSLIVFWKVSDYSKKNQETGELENRESFLLRYYNVFNACQCDGLPDLTTGPNPQPIETCERIVKGMQNPPKFEQGYRASYAPQSDTVTLPAIGCFESPEAYYATAFHEMTHSTAHVSRLHREAFDNPVHFGSEVYSKEELVAELGASMLCGQAGIAPSVLDNSASYLASWIKKLQGDSKLIVQAASAAQKAAKYIIGETAEESDTES
jgi:antirestriction protein ArdC